MCFREQLVGFKRQNWDKPVAHHLNQVGHTIHHIQVKGLWLLFTDNTNNRRAMKSHLIDKLGSRKSDRLHKKLCFWTVPVLHFQLASSHLNLFIKTGLMLLITLLSVWLFVFRRDWLIPTHCTTVHCAVIQLTGSLKLFPQLTFNDLISHSRRQSDLWQRFAGVFKVLENVLHVHFVLWLEVTVGGKSRGWVQLFFFLSVSLFFFYIVFVYFNNVISCPVRVSQNAEFLYSSLSFELEDYDRCVHDKFHELQNSRFDSRWRPWTGDAFCAASCGRQFQERVYFLYIALFLVSWIFALKSRTFHTRHLTELFFGDPKPWEFWSAVLMSLIQSKKCKLFFLLENTLMWWISMTEQHCDVSMCGVHWFACTDHAVVKGYFQHGQLTVNVIHWLVPTTREPRETTQMPSSIVVFTFGRERMTSLLSNLKTDDEAELLWTPVSARRKMARTMSDNGCLYPWLLKTEKCGEEFVKMNIRVEHSSTGKIRERNWRDLFRRFVVGCKYGRIVWTQLESRVQNACPNLNCMDSVLAPWFSCRTH